MDTRNFEDVAKLPNVKKALAEAKPITGIQFDSDIMGATKGQADLLLPGIPNLKPETVDNVTIIVGIVGLKLSALRYHAKRFEQLQEQRKQEIENDESSRAIVRQGMVMAEKEMIFEFEAFMFQIKSTLDMLVKLFVPVFGSKQADLSTYGKAGQKIVTHLRQLKRDKNKLLAHGRVDLLIELIEQAIDPWLKPLIALRDTVSHYSSQIRIGFSWDEAKEEIRVPMANVSGAEHPLVDVMKIEAERLINYSSQFIGGTILCAIPVERRHQLLTEMEKQYVGALWGMDMSRAILKLSSNVIIDYTEEHVRQAHMRHLENKAKLLEDSDTD
jgi:hypothetical protein